MSFDALVRTAETNKTIGRVLDIGSGRLLSIRDTVELLALIVGGEARPQFSAVADRPMDLARRPDPHDVAELRDWWPSTALEDGLRKTVEWYAENLALFPDRAPVRALSPI
jgi:UDP-glucose 4-epimerase